jgi:hypothetical protein
MGDETQCPTQISELLGNYLWSKEIIGVTYPCPVNQLQFILPTHQELRLQGLIHDTFTLWLHPTKGLKNLCYTHGPEEMFLGMHTDLKVLPPLVTISGSPPGLEKVEKILLNKLGPVVMEYVTSNLSGISGIDGDLLLKCCWKYISSFISHRVPANHWSPVVGPNELPTRTSYVGHKTSTDRALRSLHGDWTINFGSLLAFEMAVALYVTEFNTWQDIVNQITIWVRLQKECPHCLQAIDDIESSWPVFPRSVNRKISNNSYVGFSTEQREKLIEQINLKLQSIVEQVRVNLTSLGVQEKMRAFYTVADELVRDLSQGLSGVGMIDKKLFIPEDKLVAIKSIQKVHTIGMTELKHLPVDIIMETLCDVFTQHVFTHYPHCLKFKQEYRLMDLHFTRFSFTGISQYILESGYWDVLKINLRKHLGHLSLALPKQSSDIHRMIVEYLNIEFQQDLATKKGDLLKTSYDIHIADFLTTEELTDRHKDEVNTLSWRIFREWCGTPEGSKILYQLRNQWSSFVKK